MAEIILTPRAQEVLDVIAENPEIDKETISKNLKTSLNTTNRALVELKFRKLVTYREIGSGHKKLYSALAPKPKHVPVPENVNLSNRARLCLDVIASMNEATARMVQNQTRLSNWTVHHGIHDLLSLGLIENHRNIPRVGMRGNTTRVYRAIGLDKQLAKAEKIVEKIEEKTSIVTTSTPVKAPEIPLTISDSKIKIVVRYRPSSGPLVQYAFCTDLESVHTLLADHPEAEVYGPLEVKRSFEIVGLNK